MGIAVLGEALIDFISMGNGSYVPHLGGSPYNVAICIARQGVNASYLSPLSDDSFGDKLHQSLMLEGVKLPLKRRSNFPTSLALVTLNNIGQPSYRLYRQGIADKDVTLEEIVANLPENLSIFHTGSLAITPSQLPKISQLFKLLRDRGVLISVDINIRHGASENHDKYITGVRSLLVDADIVKASDEDLLALGISQDVRQAAENVYRDMDGGLLILTEGSGGAVIYTKRGLIKHPSYLVKKVVDTVGAGDTFFGTFLAFLIRKGKLPHYFADISEELLAQGLDFACAAAAINVSRAGCSPPTEKEVLGFIESLPHQIATKE